MIFNGDIHVLVLTINIILRADKWVKGRSPGLVGVRDIEGGGEKQ